MKSKMIIAAALACLAVTSCASFKKAGAGARDIIVRSAKNMLEKRYSYGKKDKYEGFDCSGLAQYAYSEAGMKIPRTSKAQYQKSRKISKDQLKPADLIFFSTYAPGPTHVGIYLGGGKFIHAPSEGKKVQVVDMDNSYWKKAFYGAGTYF